MCLRWSKLYLKFFSGVLACRWKILKLNPLYPKPALWVFFFDLPDYSIYLSSFQYISDNDGIDFELLRERKYFIEFTLTNIRHIVWLISLLKSLKYDNTSIGWDEFFEFENTIVETVSFEQSIVFGGYIEEDGAHVGIIGMNDETPIFALQKKNDNIHLLWIQLPAEILRHIPSQPAKMRLYNRCWRRTLPKMPKWGK